jgi:hypothetical protein
LCAGLKNLKVIGYYYCFASGVLGVMAGLNSTGFSGNKAMSAGLSIFMSLAPEDDEPLADSVDLALNWARLK